MPAGLIELTPELTGRCREEQGEVGSTLGIKDLGVGWSNVKSSGASPIGAPAYWWVGIPPGVTPAPRGLQWVSKKVLAASLSKTPRKILRSHPYPGTPPSNHANLLGCHHGVVQNFRPVASYPIAISASGMSCRKPCPACRQLRPRHRPADVRPGRSMPMESRHRARSRWRRQALWPGIIRPSAIRPIMAVMCQLQTSQTRATA